MPSSELLATKDDAVQQSVNNAVTLNDTAISDDNTVSQSFNFGENAYPCPYDGCRRQPLATQYELTDHMLEMHLMNEVLLKPSPSGTTEELLSPFSALSSLETPVSTINEPLVQTVINDGSIDYFNSNSRELQSDQLLSELGSISDSSYRDPWGHWNDLHCKEPECVGFPVYKSAPILVEHYDSYHGFIPESLLHFSFEDIVREVI
jgi:hypothetical protein